MTELDKLVLLRLPEYERIAKRRGDAPWVKWYEEMAKKTIIRKLFKYLPVSIEAQKAASGDEAVERGEKGNMYIIEELEETIAPPDVVESKAEKISNKLEVSDDFTKEEVKV